VEFTKEEASEVAGVVDDNGLFATNLREKPLANFRMRVVWIKVVNFVLVGVLFFQLKWNVSVSECFGVPFRGCTVHIYIYIYIYIQQT